MAGNRLREFVEDSDGRGSAARLNMVIGVIVGSIVVLWLAIVKNNLGGEIFGTFMLATGGVYGFGKWRESVERVEQTKADSPNQPSLIAPVVAPLGPMTTVNVSGQPKPEAAKDVNIAVEGNMNVSPKPKQRK